MITIDFDVNLISQIHFRPSCYDKDYVWKTDLTEIKYKRFFFGIFKMKDGVEYLPAGFYKKTYRGYYEDICYWDRVQDEEFDRCGYVIKEFGNHGGISYRKEAWRKAYVKISLGYKSTVSRHFNNDEEVKLWIDKLKELSGKTFETIIL